MSPLTSKKKEKTLFVFFHCYFAESFVTTKNSFGLHLVNDIFDDLNGGNIKWAESS